MCVQNILCLPTHLTFALSPRQAGSGRHREQGVAHSQVARPRTCRAQTPVLLGVHVPTCLGMAGRAR